MERTFDFCSKMLTSGGFARRTDGEYELSVTMRLVQFEKKDIIINCYKGPRNICDMGCFVRTPGTDDWELLAATYCLDIQKFPPGLAKLPLRSKSRISLEKSKYVPVQKIFSKIFSPLGKF